MNTEYLDAKSLLIRSCKQTPPLQNSRGCYSTTSSLNKGRPSSEVCVSACTQARVCVCVENPQKTTRVAIYTLSLNK